MDTYYIIDLEVINYWRLIIIHNYECGLIMVHFANRKYVAIG